jgi:hypothetical protein
VCPRQCVTPTACAPAHGRRVSRSPEWNLRGIPVEPGPAEPNRPTACPTLPALRRWAAELGKALARCPVVSVPAGALSGRVRRVPHGQPGVGEAAPEGRKPEQARGPQLSNTVVDNHQMIAIEDFTPLSVAKSTMAGKSADAAIGAAKAELIQRGTRAGRTVVVMMMMVAPAHPAMTFGVRAETSTPAAGDGNPPVRALRVHRRSRPQCRRSDSGHGDRYPRRCWQRQTCAASLRVGCRCCPTQKSPSFSRL